MKDSAQTSTGTILVLLLAFVLGFLALWSDPAGSAASKEVGVGMLLARPSEFWGHSVRLVGSVTNVESQRYVLTDRSGNSIVIRTGRVPRLGAEVLVVAMAGQDPANALRPVLVELDRDSLRRSLQSVLLAVCLVILASVGGIALVIRADRRLRRASLPDPVAPAAEGAEAAAPLVRLQVLQGPDRGKVFEFDQPEISIGRPGARANHVSLSDSTISRSQCRIVRSRGGLIFENESATNPTRVNGQAVPKSEIIDGDRLEMGESVLRVSMIPREELVS
jgi:type III secretion system (T3SS) inner membrane Yop/YscD-like protein